MKAAPPWGRFRYPARDPCPIGSPGRIRPHWGVPSMARAPRSILYWLIPLCLFCGTAAAAGGAEAQELYDAAVALYPGDPDAAIAKFKAAIEADPDFVAAYAGLAWAAWEKKHDAGLALGYLDQAVQRRPDWFVPHMMKGQIYFAVYDNLRAVESLERALALLPSEPGLAGQAMVLRLTLGAAYRRTGRYAKAIGQFEAILAAAPQDLLALNQMGLTCAAKGEYDAAREWYRKALAADEKFPTTWYNMACACALAKDAARAAENLEKAIELDPAYRDKAREDHDFDAVRGEAPIAALLED